MGHEAPGWPGISHSPGLGPVQPLPRWPGVAEVSRGDGLTRTEAQAQCLLTNQCDEWNWLWSRWDLTYRPGWP